MVNKGQIIITADVTQEENDVQQLYRMTEEDNEGLKAVGVKEKIRNELADARYRSEDYSIEGVGHCNQAVQFLFLHQNHYGFALGLEQV
ncbi:MAG: hypothetical protein SU899_04485, partial [Chloroflexota bacterium]|nr:hypothetical protein [Chloroflexota bacterium]